MERHGASARVSKSLDVASQGGPLTDRNLELSLLLLLSQLGQDAFAPSLFSLFKNKIHVTD